MKIDINDPRITAFALGELKGEEALELARAVRNDPRVRAAVDDIRETSFLLMESLGGGEAHMLTPSQRDSVRSAGARPVIEDLASARVSFWKKPMVVGIGVAAAVALGLFVVNDRPAGDGSQQIADSPQRWDWSRVDTRELTSPVAVGVGDTPMNEEAKAVASAVSDDTESFRSEVEKRIGKSRLNVANQQLKLKANAWQDTVEGEVMTTVVPMVSGASSWPWLERYVNERQELPPKVSVRVEEWLNHFRYQTPSQLTGEQLVADVEICDTPWNPASQLVAVHVAARPGVDSQGAGARLEWKSDSVRRVRLLGYSEVVEAGDSDAGRLQKVSRTVSRSQGNYVLYEIELTEQAESGRAILNLVLDGQSRLGVDRRVSWIHASSDLRFASLVAASAMMVSDHGDLAELDAGKIESMAKLIGLRDSGGMVSERREAMKVLEEVAKLLKTSE